MPSRFPTGLVCLWLLAGSSALQAEAIINEIFSGYPDDALISASPPS